MIPFFKIFSILMSVLLVSSLSLGLEITLDNPPQNFRTYSWDNQSHSIIHTGSTRGYRTMSLQIPDRFAVGLNPQTDLPQILENWRASSPQGRNQPVSRNNISYFPYTDSTGQTRYIALSYLLQRQSRYPDMQIQISSTTPLNPSNTQDTQLTSEHVSPTAVEDTSPVISSVVNPAAAAASIPSPTSFASPSPASNAPPVETLYIGDSHSTLPAYRDIITQALGAQNTHYYASCGSNAGHWVRGGYSSSCGQINTPSTQPLSQLQQATGAQRVIINLGDNHIRWSDSRPKVAQGIASNAASQIQDLIQQIPENVQCYWVGPVNGSSGSTYRKSTQVVSDFYALLQRTVGSRCTIVDCRSVVPQSRGDGLHYNDPSAWARCVAERTNNGAAPSDPSDAASFVEP